MNLLMDNLSENLKSKLDDNIYSRNSKDDVINAIKELGVYPSKEFIQFYSTYAGPFFEETLGLELMDIVEDKIEKRSLKMKLVAINKKCAIGIEYNNLIEAITEQLNLKEE